MKMTSPYLDYLSLPGQVENPWAAMTDQALGNLNNASAATAQLPGMQFGVMEQQDAMGDFAASTSYPTFKNDFGIGSQDPLGSSPAPAATPQPNSSSRGFNPWSLQGEALSR